MTSPRHMRSSDPELRQADIPSPVPSLLITDEGSRLRDLSVTNISWSGDHNDNRYIHVIVI